MQRADAIDGELYFVVGMIGFAEKTSPELMALLRDPQYFEAQPKRWAQEPIHHLEAYHYRRQSLPPGT
jgi:hypothetical protein